MVGMQDMISRQCYVPWRFVIHLFTHESRPLPKAPAQSPSKRSSMSIDDYGIPLSIYVFHYTYQI
jgi:hypothetical protein